MMPMWARRSRRMDISCGTASATGGEGADVSIGMTKRNSVRCIRTALPPIGLIRPAAAPTTSLTSWQGNAKAPIMLGRHDRTLLITGGAGFIGSHLGDLARAHGHRVIVVDVLT